LFVQVVPGDLGVLRVEGFFGILELLRHHSTSLVFKAYTESWSYSQASFDGARVIPIAPEKL
jgi:hypothetical protein